MTKQTSISPEKRPVRVGLGVLPQPMTRAQARRYGEANLPADIKAAGFGVSVFASNPEIHGEKFFRVLYGKTVKSGKGAS